MKKSRKTPLIFFTVAIVIIAIVFISSITGFTIFEGSSDNRPKHCINKTVDGRTEESCVDSSVFKNLPSFPKDFYEVWTLVYYNRLQVLENFTPGVDDSVYYLQPEFYENLFDTTGLEFYTGYKENQVVNISYMGIFGYGAYPMDYYRQILPDEEGRRGGIVDIVTFWHSSWNVIRYQGFNLQPIYPSKGRAASWEVEQDPEIVKKYIKVTIDPQIFLLGYSYPIFHKNWAQNVKIRMEVDPQIPSGRYYVGITTTALPPNLEEKYIRDYRFSYVSASAAPVGTGAPTVNIVLDVA